MGEDDEPMAWLRFDFISGFGTRITGSNQIDKLSHANKMCETLNDLYGPGTHWVEPMNFTKAERAMIAAFEGERDG